MVPVKDLMDRNPIILTGDTRFDNISKFSDVVVDNVQLGIIIIDDHGYIKLFNTEMERISGVLSENIIDKKIEDISREDGFLRKLNTEKITKKQSYLLCGETLLVNEMPVIQGGVLAGTLIIVQDVSKQTALACSLNSIREHNRELDSIIEAFSDGIYISDEKGFGIRVNKAYEQLTGLTSKELINKDLAEIVARGIISKSSTLKAIEKKKPITYTQKYKDNKELLVSSNPVFNDGGEVYRIVTTVRDVTELNQLQKRLSESDERSKKYYQELILLREQQMETGEIVAVSQSMRAVVDLAKRAAKVDSTCLILGESGVGKDVIARLIHANGKRCKQPFIKINCGAIPRELLEAELFGYEVGAFTGARKEGKPGMFELAHEGTFFLDEIGEMPLDLQVKLLEILQDRTLYRVGGTKPIRIDVRIIAATNRNLAEMVKNGLFREDLYYRLNIIPIEIPPLRERPEDILPLVEMMLRQLNERFAKNTTLSSEVQQCLLNYQWPGNIRELHNIIERMMVMSREEIVGMEYVPRGLSKQCENLIQNISSNKLQEVLEEVEKKLLLKNLRECKTIRKAAEALGVDHSTVCRKIQKYNLADKY